MRKTAIATLLVVFFMALTAAPTAMAWSHSDCDSKVDTHEEPDHDFQKNSGYTKHKERAHDDSDHHHSPDDKDDESDTVEGCDDEPAHESEPPINHAPVIILIGQNPATTTVGASFTDPGATATDEEDGNLTSQITASSTVNTAAAGTYTIVYSVTDSGGLVATTTRTVIVLQADVPLASEMTIVATKIVCDKESDLPNWSGAHVDISTTTAVDFIALHSSTCHVQANWKFQWSFGNATDTPPAPVLPGNFIGDATTTQDFSPWNTFGPTDAQGVATTSISNLHGAFRVWVREVLQTGYMSFSYPGTNSPVSAEMWCNTDVLNYDNYDFISPATLGGTYQCIAFNALEAAAPNANLTITKTVDKVTANTGDTLTYTINVVNNGPSTAASTSATDVLPAGLNFISATSTLGSYSTTTSIWTIGDMASGSSTTLTIITTIKTGSEGQKITNSVVASSSVADSNPGDNTTNVDVVINTPPAATTGCATNCGGGGGGGGGGNASGGGSGGGQLVPINLVIFNEQVVETFPGVAMVTWSTNVPATRRVVYGATGVSVVGHDENYGYATSTNYFTTPLLTAHSLTIYLESGKTYYFRPVSTNATYTAVGKELILARSTGGTTVATPIRTITDTPCYYLHDYLRRDFQNNPVEVKKLQIFLKDLEGFSNLAITGIYDEATIAMTDSFQIRYKNEVLTPWGYDGAAGTDYTYILTKKKVNEIYCKHAFPVNTQQQAEIDATRALFESLRNEGINLKNAATSTDSGSSTPIQNTIIPIVGEVTTNLPPSVSLASPLTSLMPFSLASVFLPLGCSGYCAPLLIVAALAVWYLWYSVRKRNKKLREINEEMEKIDQEINVQVWRKKT